MTFPSMLEILVPRRQTGIHVNCMTLSWPGNLEVVLETVMAKPVMMNKQPLENESKRTSNDSEDLQDLVLVGSYIICLEQ